MDEATFLVNSYISRSWHQKGTRPTKKYAYDKKKKIGVFGAIGKNEIITHTSDSLNSQNFIKFLEKILAKHEKVLLIMDNVQMHFSKLMMPFYRQHSELQILRTPKYSPQFNPIEIYWRNVKQWIGLHITLNIKHLDDVLKKAFQKSFLRPTISEI